MPRQDVAKRLAFNGINGRSGAPAFRHATVEEVLTFARGRRPGKSEIELAQRHRYDTSERFLDLEDGVDPCKLEEAGWGVIFPRQGNSEIREALEPLMRWREEQAKARDERLFKIYGNRAGTKAGYSSREVVSRFLERRGACDGPVRPREMPYYLLLVGGPEEIPFDFQYQLDVRYAVGRLDFATPEEYAAYAANVVALERRFAQGELPKQRRAALFAPWQPGEAVEEFLVADLVRPLGEELERTRSRGFKVEAVVNQHATRERLLALLGGEAAVDLLFTACHGLVYDDHPETRDEQGALLCHGHLGQSDPRRYAVGASEVAGRANASGQITMHFGCFSAGIPVWDGFGLRPDGTPCRYADQPFTTALPRRLLCQPGGTTLAVIGHVDRAWTYSFASTHGAPRRAIFEQCLKRLLKGKPVGYALEPFNLRHAALSAEWLGLLQKEQLEPWAKPRNSEMLDTFCTWLDAKSFVVLGDPAVRLAMAGETLREI